MVDVIAGTPKYQEFESKHNRHLNMLAENVSTFDLLVSLTYDVAYRIVI